MGKLTKNQKLAAEKIEAGKAYSLKEAASLVKEITFSKFDAASFSEYAFPASIFSAANF